EDLACDGEVATGVDLPAVVVDSADIEMDVAAADARGVAVDERPGVNVYHAGGRGVAVEFGDQRRVGSVDFTGQIVRAALLAGENGPRVRRDQFAGIQDQAALAELVVGQVEAGDDAGVDDLGRRLSGHAVTDLHGAFQGGYDAG